MTIIQSEHFVLPSSIIEKGKQSKTISKSATAKNYVAKVEEYHETYY